MGVTFVPSRRDVIFSTMPLICGKIDLFYFIYLFITNDISFITNNIHFIIKKKEKKKKRETLYQNSHTHTGRSHKGTSIFLRLVFLCINLTFFFLQFFYTRLYAHKSMSRFQNWDLSVLVFD